MYSIERMKDIIEGSENQAIDLGDLKTAIQLNWLRNALDSNMDVEEAMVYFQNIIINGQSVATYERPELVA